MMGWRVGYIAFPKMHSDSGGVSALAAGLEKVQDTIPICPSQVNYIRNNTFSNLFAFE